MGSKVIRRREVSFLAYFIMSLMIIGMAVAPIVLDYLFASGIFFNRECSVGFFGILDGSYFIFILLTVGILGYIIYREIKSRDIN